MNSKVLQSDVLSVLMLGRVLALIQALSKWDAFGVNGVGSLSYSPR